MDFDALKATLNRKHVKSRNQGGSAVSYIEAWHAIAEANRIFGFDSWTRETVEFRVVSERERLIGKAQKPGWSVTYIAKVRVMAVRDDGKWLAREGCGAGHGIDVDLGQAHESALKEAESDAMKRALMTFGNPFGLALYDKTQAKVEDVDAQEAFAARCVEVAGKIRSIASLQELQEFWVSLNKREIGVASEVSVIKAKDERKAALSAEQERAA